MDVVTATGLVVAGFIGAAMNSVVGAGTLITFPALLATGTPPVIANGTNTLGLSIGSWSAAYSYRRELSGRSRVVLPALVGSILGAAVGSLLVIVLPEKVFAAAVPWLILTATILVAVAPLVARRSRRTGLRAPTRRWPLPVTIGASGVYGGYFGAGQGVVLMAVLGWLYDSSPQHANAAKNLFAGAANLTAAVVFVVSGRVWWWAAMAIASGAVLGGTLGARGARRLPPEVLRGLVVVVGVVASIWAWIRW